MLLSVMLASARLDYAPGALDSGKTTFDFGSDRFRRVEPFGCGDSHHVGLDGRS
jgi:hypothetical protein